VLIVPSSSGGRDENQLVMVSRIGFLGFGFGGRSRCCCLGPARVFDSAGSVASGSTILQSDEEGSYERERITLHERRGDKSVSKISATASGERGELHLEEKSLDLQISQP